MTKMTECVPAVIVAAGPVARVVAAVGEAVRGVASVLAVGEGPVAVGARAPPALSSPRTTWYGNRD